MATATEQAKWNYVRPEMYPKQLAAIFDPRRYSFIEASTKSGKTVGCMAWIAEKAMMGKPGWNYWWIAPTFATAHIPFDRLQRRLPKGFCEVNKSQMTIHLIPTDTMIWFKGSDKPDSLYGEDVHAAVVDEASRCKEESWFALRSTLTATKGPVRVIGNVKGKKNWFFRLARRAEKGDSEEMGYHKITADDAVAAQVLDRKEIDDARDVLPEAVFKELYEAEASDDEGNPFGLKAIEACAIEKISTEPVVAWGIDLARKHDYTVGVGLDRYGDVADFFRFQRPWDQQVSFIREKVGSLPTLVDATGVGDGIVGFLQSPILRTAADPADDLEELLALQDIGLESDKADSILEGMLKNSPELRRLFGDTNIEGFLFNSRSKQMLMETLAVAIQHHNVHFPRWADASRTTEHVLKLELESYEYVYTRTGVRYSAPDGEYDDTVCALALALQCLTTRAMTMTADFDLGALVEGFSQNSTWDIGRERKKAAANGDQTFGEISLGW